MDGKGRAVDNIYIERWWNSFKHEDLYLNQNATMGDLRRGIERYVTSKTTADSTRRSATASALKLSPSAQAASSAQKRRRSARRAQSHRALLWRDSRGLQSTTMC
jgi:murein L,D-transpeptidase YafK